MLGRERGGEDGRLKCDLRGSVPAGSCEKIAELQAHRQRTSDGNRLPGHRGNMYRTPVADRAESADAGAIGRAFSAHPGAIMAHAASRCHGHCGRADEIGGVRANECAALTFQVWLQNACAGA